MRPIHSDLKKLIPLKFNSGTFLSGAVSSKGPDAQGSITAHRTPFLQEDDLPDPLFSRRHRRREAAPTTAYDYQVGLEIAGSCRFMITH